MEYWSTWSTGVLEQWSTGAIRGVQKDPAPRAQYSNTPLRVLRASLPCPNWDLSLLFEDLPPEHFQRMLSTDALEGRPVCGKELLLDQGG
jgi:hypothetical protein